MSVSSKSTKSEILAAYETLLEENERLQQELSDFVPNRSEPGTREGISEVAASIRALQGRIGNAIGDYQNSVVNELQLLKEIQGSLEKERSELQALHSITPQMGKTLGELVLSYEEFQKRASDEIRDMKSARQEHEREFNKMLQQETEAWQTASNLRREARKVEAARNEEEYAYHKKMRAKQDEDQDAQESKEFSARLDLAIQEFTQRWNEKFEDLAKRKQVYMDLDLKMNTLKTDLDRLVGMASKEGEGIGKSQVDKKRRMLAADHKANLERKRIELASFEQAIARGDIEVDKLQTRLDKIRADNQQLSNSALNIGSQGSKEAAATAESIATEFARGGSNKRA